MPNQHREVIDHFTGPYAFLSNFQPCRVFSLGRGSFPSGKMRKPSGPGTVSDYDTTASETPWPTDPDAK